MRSLIVIALICLLNAAVAADFSAERNRAEALLKDGKVEAYATAIEQLSRQGDSRSQAWYGYYLQRNGNLAEAEKWLMMSARSGDSQGQLRLGALYILMSPPRSAEATKWLKLAAAQGNERAKFILHLIEYPLSQPKVVKGLAQTAELADLQYSTLKTMLSSLDGVLACYRTNHHDIDRVFGPAAKKCKDLSLQEYGNTIPVSDYYEFSRDYGGCVRTVALKNLGISTQELVECTKKIP